MLSSHFTIGKYIEELHWKRPFSDIVIVAVPSISLQRGEIDKQEAASDQL